MRGICGAKVGATDGNVGKHTKGGIDYDRRNLIRGGSAVGHRSGTRLQLSEIDLRVQEKQAFFQNLAYVDAVPMKQIWNANKQSELSDLKLFFGSVQ